MKLFKRALLWGLGGIPIGVFIGNTLLLVFVHLYGNSFATFDYLLRQYLLDMLVGFTFSGAAALFSAERLSRLAQTALHFCILLAVFLPCALAGGWIPQKPAAVAGFLAIFVCVYACYWLSFYFYWKGKVRRLNAALHKTGH